MTDIQPQTIGRTLTVGELIAVLSGYDPALRVGIRAQCGCSFSHDIDKIRMACHDGYYDYHGDDDADDHDLIIKVGE